MQRKIYIHKNEINLFRTSSYGTQVRDINLRLVPTDGYIECDICVPERSVTITEEQFEMAFAKEGSYLISHSGVVSRIRDSFFGERK